MHLKHKMSMALAAALAMAASPAIHAAPQHGQGAHAGRVVQGMVADPDTCDPFSDWDDEVDSDGSGGSNGGDDSTSKLLPTSTHPHAVDFAHRGSGDFHGMDSAARVIGTTPEAVQRNFLQVVTHNLSNAGTRSRIAHLSDRELGAIARHAAQGAPVERAELLKLFATRLDDASLVRVARAFGRAPVEAAVHAYADPASRAAFDGAVAGLMAPPPEEGGGGGGSYPRPNLNMTLEEIYLEFRTAPVGSLSPSAALAETSMYAGGWLYISWKTGQKIGTEMHELISAYAPNLDDAIGGTIAAMIDNMQQAMGDVEMGHYEAALDELLGFPVTTSSNPWGDWDISTPMVDYYNSSNTCGY